MPALLIKTDIRPEKLRRLACREDDARVTRRLLALAMRWTACRDQQRRRCPAWTP
jgi:hypothetical protein